jgi:hypothetical protein
LPATGTLTVYQTSTPFERGGIDDGAEAYRSPLTLAAAKLIVHAAAAAKKRWFDNDALAHPYRGWQPMCSGHVVRSNVCHAKLDTAPD